MRINLLRQQEKKRGLACWRRLIDFNGTRDALAGRLLNSQKDGAGRPCTEDSLRWGTRTHVQHVPHNLVVGHLVVRRVGDGRDVDWRWHLESSPGCQCSSGNLRTPLATLGGLAEILVATTSGTGAFELFGWRVVESFGGDDGNRGGVRGVRRRGRWGAVDCCGWRAWRCSRWLAVTLLSSIRRAGSRRSDGWRRGQGARVVFRGTAVDRAVGERCRRRHAMPSS